MYRITCDGLPILDLRDEDYIVDSPRVKMGTNTVGEGSFKIYKTHPHYEDMKKLKSVFEISDDYGVIFRGRMTDSTTDFNNGKKVDLEGVLAYFNDSLIKPFSFPEDFQNDAAYNAAAKSGNVVEFLLGWIIEQHNNQVQPFQRFKLGRVTVSDPNNYIYRASESGYITGWEAVKTKLFESALGGYLCIRYEADGNYIDYLEDFEEINAQEIVFGENLVDFLQEETATATYTAAVPYGSEVGEEQTLLTIESLPDGDINADIVKKGDTLYSKSGVERFGWIYAPISDTTWDDVTDAANLQKKCVDFLENTAMFLTNTIELSAADLHYTDGQIMSFRIYKKVKVNSKPHNLSAVYKLTELEIPLLEPQGTKITVGETRKSLLNMQKDEQYFLNQNMQVISEKVVSVDKATREAMEKLELTDETLLNWCHENDKTLIDGAKLYTGSVKAEQIAAGTITGDKIATGTLTAENIAAGTVTTDKIKGKAITADKIAAGTITSDKIAAGTIKAEKIDLADLFAQYIEAENMHIYGESTVSGHLKCYGMFEIQSEELGSEAYLGFPDDDNYWIVVPDFTVDNGVFKDTSQGRDVPAFVMSFDHELTAFKTRQLISGNEIVGTIMAADDMRVMGPLKVAGDALIHGNITLTNPLSTANGGTGYSYRWTTHTFTVNAETSTELITPLVRYYPYLGLAFMRVGVKTTGTTAAGAVCKIGTLSCQPSYMQPVSGYASKEFDAYVNYSDSGVYIRARESIAAGYEIRINGWFTIQ